MSAACSLVSVARNRLPAGRLPLIWGAPLPGKGGKSLLCPSPDAFVAMSTPHVSAGAQTSTAQECGAVLTLPVRVQGPVASLRLSVCVWVLQQLQLFHDGGTIRFTQCVLSCGADAMAAAAAAGRPARRWRRWRQRQRQQQRAGLRGCGLLVCLCGLLFGSGVLLHSSHAAAPRSDRIAACSENEKTDCGEIVEITKSLCNLPNI